MASAASHRTYGSGVESAVPDSKIIIFDAVGNNTF